LYLILAVPTYLILDFGIFYGCYLRGASISRIILFELIYDYIAILIFYARILAQGARFIIIALTYASFQDYILYSNDAVSILLLKSVSFYVFEINYHMFSNFTYTLTQLVPTLILKVFYEVLHLLFTVISQIVALFAIIM
jgi:hypothetical protein